MPLLSGSLAFHRVADIDKLTRRPAKRLDSPMKPSAPRSILLGPWSEGVDRISGHYVLNVAMPRGLAAGVLATVPLHRGIEGVENLAPALLH